MEYFKSIESGDESDCISVYFDGEVVYFNGESVNNDYDNCRVNINGGEVVCATSTLIDGESSGVYTRNTNILADGERNLNDNNESPCMYANQSKVSFR